VDNTALETLRDSSAQPMVTLVSMIRQPNKMLFAMSHRIFGMTRL
jgi:hypothetical protein